MIDRLRSKDREVTQVMGFDKGELYFQHCQQNEDYESPEDILRIFRVGNNAVFSGDSLVLMDNPVYTTRLDPSRFDKGVVNTLDQFRINFETYMGHFYHIPNGYHDIEDIFGVHLQEHERMEQATGSQEELIGAAETIDEDAA